MAGTLLVCRAFEALPVIAVAQIGGEGRTNSLRGRSRGYVRRSGRCGELRSRGRNATRFS